jgi:hypothetical protein
MKKAEAQLHADFMVTVRISAAERPNLLAAAT